MDQSKFPYGFLPELSLQDIQLFHTQNRRYRINLSQSSVSGEVILEGEQETSTSTFLMNAIDFPPLHVFESRNRQSDKIRPLRQ